MANEFENAGVNLRIYVIGDIHGRSDLLDKIIDEICCDIDSYPSRQSLTITLGDYVDRGPDLRGVLDRLSKIRFPQDTSLSEAIMKICSKQFCRILRPVIIGQRSVASRRSTHTGFRWTNLP